MKWLRSLFLLVLFPASELCAQEFSEKDFTLYTTTQGLSHNYITAVAQDSVGYIWVATSAGLNRFDGSRFKQFHSTTDSNSLPADAIWSMNWLNKDQLAVYTAGLHVVNTKTNERRNLFVPYHVQQYQYKFNVMIGAVRGDEQGNIFIVSRSGFYHYDKNFKQQFRFDYYNDEQVPVQHFYFGKDLMELDDRRLLVLSIGGFFIYDKIDRKFKKMELSDYPLLDEFLNFPHTGYQMFQLQPGRFFVMKSETDSLVYVDLKKNQKIISRLPLQKLAKEFGWRSRLVAANDSMFYLTGQYSGFFKLIFHRQTGTVEMNPKKFFSSELCMSILIDKQKQLWIATNKGLYHQDKARASVEVAAIPEELIDSFPNLRLGDVYVSGNNIWVAAKGDGGLLMFNKKDFKFTRQVFYTKDNGGLQVNSIVPFNQSLLLGTNGPLFLFNEKKLEGREYLPPQWRPGWWANDVFQDSRGDFWISTIRVFHYNSATKQFTVKPILPQLLTVTFTFEEDKTGHIWMGGHGLARFNEKLDSFDLVIDSFPFIKMPDKQVNAFTFDDQNVLWFNSNNNGLIAYDINSKNFRHFTTANGLPDNNITSLMTIGDKLWIATFSGIACMDLHTYQVVSFSKADGFPDVPVTKGAKFFFDKPTGKLYISFENGLVRFDPVELLRKKSPPHLFFESLLLNSEKNIFLPTEKITTHWRDDQVTFSIGSINFSDGQSQGFAYRVLGLHSNDPWQQLGNQSSFTISNLSPGSYHIEIKCFSTNNRWPEQTRRMELIVMPPFWKKDWFVITLTALLLVVFYLFISWRTGRVRKKEMEKTQLEKIKADHYKNQFELEQISNYFSSSLADKKTEEEVLWDVTNNLIGRMNFEDCIIYMWNDDKTRMIQKAAYGPKGKPELITEQFFDVKPGQGIVGEVMLTRQPVVVNDTRFDGRYRVDDDFRLSEVCVPIIHDDELLGIIDSEHHLPNYFSERDIKMLTTIGTLIGNKLKQIASEQSLDAKRKELATTNEQLAEARLAALQSQMNPHFVFNALNSIKRMILDGDNDKASRYLSKFALMIRMTLNHSKETFVTLDENIEYLNTYLEMERLRFDDSFTYKISANENIEAAETLIPSMMIQPLVENAIWHGLMQAEGSKQILISFDQQENKIVCTVEDNGIGFRQSEKLKKKTTNTAHHSMGLENLQKRVRIMNEKYDMDCSLRIMDLKENGNGISGTRVILQFNLINA